MRIILENASLKVEFESFGAEIKSLVRKADGKEYMWSGDPAYWGKTAPFLFPFIGKLQDEQFIYQGKAYKIDKHGFGQRVPYEVVEQDAEHIRFRTADTEETYGKFPFHFELDVEYVLLEDSVRENWYVKNTGDSPMYFSVGGHAAFACPPGGGDRTGSFVKLYGVEEKTIIFSLRLDENGLVTDELMTLDIRDGRFPITEHLFDKDALIFDGEGVTAAALCDPSGEEYVRVECDAPVWGVWTHPNNGAAYVCLEPWYGICDYAGYDGSLQDRPYTNVVQPGEIWRGGNTIKLGKSLDKQD